jgi:inosine/xanthosine triphosphate pyrophosphatase family protein
MTTARRKASGKGRAPGTGRPLTPKAPATGLLDRLTSEEADIVLRRLLDKHPELRAEAGQMAADLVTSLSAEEVAEDVFHRVTGVGLDELNDRAGSHSWGYVEPSEAANELLEESIEDLVEDMKRKAEFGLAPAAEVLCTGIVCGLYRARKTQSDGALGWDPDFPAGRAGYTVKELIRAYPPAARQAALERLVELLVRQAPEWEDMFRRLGQQGVKD